MEEIFQIWNDHLLKGIMLYTQLSNCMDFSNMHGYKRKFEYESIEAFYTKKYFERYFINHYDKMLKDNNVENINIIPNEYSIYKRDAITRDFKKQYIKESLSKVKKYYQDTISFLNTAIKKATEENQMQDIEIFKKQLECYNCRLKKMNRHLIKLNDINYDINLIETLIQPDIHEKYKKKEEEFKWSF